jgi:hypothetical protein
MATHMPLNIRMPFPWPSSNYRLALLLACGTLAGCHSAPMGTAVGTSGNTGQQAPFSAKQNGGRTSPSLPSSVTVPAGTPISVRLQDSLSSEMAHAGQRFGAVLDEPLVVHGLTVVPRGATVTGRVLAVRRSGALGTGGILQLALESVDAAGEKVALQTSNVIASSAVGGKDAPSSAYSHGRRVSVGAERRLTFRLRQAVVVATVVDPMSSPPRS